MTKPPPCADPELTREWPDDDDERCPFCNAKYGEPCRLETYDADAEEREADEQAQWVAKPLV